MGTGGLLGLSEWRRDPVLSDPPSSDSVLFAVNSAHISVLLSFILKTCFPEVSLLSDEGDDDEDETVITAVHINL